MLPSDVAPRSTKSHETGFLVERFNRSNKAVIGINHLDFVGIQLKPTAMRDFTCLKAALTGSSYGTCARRVIPAVIDFVVAITYLGRRLKSP
ncbi:hypothetical protein [Celeribacter sp. ULVN23_4]